MQQRQDRRGGIAERGRRERVKIAVQQQRQDSRRGEAG